MSGIAIITEACIDVKDRACVDVCPVQCIYEVDMSKGVLFSEDEAGSGTVENTHTPNPDAVAIFGDSLLYVNVDECTSCTACYQDDVCPVGAIYSEEEVPDGASNTSYNSDRSQQGARPQLLHPADPGRVRRLARPSARPSRQHSRSIRPSGSPTGVRLCSGCWRPAPSVLPTETAAVPG